MALNRQTTPLERRAFLRNALATAGTVAALPAMHGLGLVSSVGRVQAKAGDGGYGPLFPAPDMRDGVARISLPEGFSYRSFSVSGMGLSGSPGSVPIAMDGMAVFNMPEGRFRLVRNHEDRNGPGAGTIAPSAGAYDALAGGGTTTLVVNPFTRELEADFVSCSGTIVNCSGGLTPWQTWVTCEETNAGTPQGWARQHGYCFEVPAAANGDVTPAPIPAMGRFSHEALAVDPDSGIVYETEDSGDSGFYRYVPNTPGVLASGGRLQMLAVAGMFNYDTKTGQTVGVKLPVTWVDIADPNPPGQGSNDVYDQGFALGGAIFTRLEGCWYGNGAIYFDATNGGNAGEGQVWEYRPAPNGKGGGTLTLIFESPGAGVLNSPDNLAVSPKGAILLCEDGDGDQFLRGVTLKGQIFDFAENLQTTHEWAGATFAVAPAGWNAPQIRGPYPAMGGVSDRTTLFVNRQGSTSGAIPAPTSLSAGITFAIWGPWEKGAL